MGEGRHWQFERKLLISILSVPRTGLAARALFDGSRIPQNA